MIIDILNVNILLIGANSGNSLPANITSRKKLLGLNNAVWPLPISSLIYTPHFYHFLTV